MTVRPDRTASWADLPGPPPEPVPEPPRAATAPRSKTGRQESKTGRQDAAIVLEDVRRSFGKQAVVDGLTFHVKHGSILGLIGPSGAGKTTTIRMLTGAVAPTGGRIRVLGEDPQRFSRKVRERLGYMPQLFSLWRDLSAQDNVDFVASLFGMLYPSRRRATRRVLELVELWDARGTRTADLSGGMQRRLELASMLVHDPAVAFLDEPTAGVDPLLRGTIWDELQRRKDDGRTLLVTTQYINEAEECDAVALISDGRLIAFASPDELRRMATEGDLVEVATTDPFDGRRLSGLPFVRAFKQLDRRHLRITVDDAGEATPRIVTEIDDAGGEVQTAHEARPSFDDVFAALVDRHRRERNGDEGDDGHATPADQSRADPPTHPRTGSLPGANG